MKRITLNSIDSTNSYAEKNANNIDGNVLIIAKSQTNGRGQFDRKWFSEAGKSIALSFLLKKTSNNKKLSNDFLQQIPAIVSSTINKLYHVNSKVVLPNDIYIGHRKLCGLLIETSYMANAFKYAVVGIGLNLNNDTFPEEIVNTATSIRIETNHICDENEFIDKLEKNMEELYE